MSLHFSNEEFKNRKSKVLESMKNENIDALLMFRQDRCTGLLDMILLAMFFFKV